MSDADIQRTLGSIEAGIEELLRRVTVTDEVISAQGERLRSLELWRSFLSGISLILTSAVALGFKLMTR